MRSFFLALAIIAFGPAGLIGASTLAHADPITWVHIEGDTTPDGSSWRWCSAHQATDGTTCAYWPQGKDPNKGDAPLAGQQAPDVTSSTVVLQRQTIVVAPAYVTIQCWQSSLFGGYWRYFNVPAGMGCPTEYVYPAGVNFMIWGSSSWGGYVARRPHHHH